MKLLKYYVASLFFALFSFLGLLACQDQGTRYSFQGTARGAFDIATQASYDSLLNRYVDSRNLVHYEEWHKNDGDTAKLKSFLESVGKADDSSMTPDERKAFYINAYNAMTLDLILSHYDETLGGASSPYPAARSIRNISNLDTQVWDRFQWQVAGRPRTLNDVENKLLRPMGDARIHFAIVCASMGCPPLYPHAFTAATLNETLDSLAKAFVNSGRNTTFDRSQGKLRTSHILDWFASDFVKTFGSVQAFFEKYAQSITLDEMRGMKVEFDDYDWTLNQALPQPLPSPSPTQTPPQAGSGTEYPISTPEPSPSPSQTPQPVDPPGSGSGTEREIN